jgi:hypothetical protein
MRYKVISKQHRVFRKSFGEFFERNLSEAQERHLIGGGFIVRAPKKNRPTPAIVPVVEPLVVELPETPPVHDVRKEVSPAEGSLAPAVAGVGDSEALPGAELSAPGLTDGNGDQE